MPAPSEFPSLVCAEHIAVLNVLHTTPLRPTTNNIDPCFTEVMNRKHILSFEQERCIVGALSFLAGVSDSSDNVAAVCIQEIGHVADKKSLRLLFAINQDTARQNSSLIDELKSGYKAVLSPLNDIIDGSDADYNASLGETEKKVLLAIITMCKNRILGRLRLVSSNRKGPGGQKQRQPFKNLLRKVTESLKTMTDQEKILDAIKNVTSLFSNLVGHQVVSEIYHLVLSMSRLKKLPGLHEAISTIPNAEVDPNSRESFMNIVTKMARYHEVSLTLCCMAADKGLAVVRRWTVVHADLPPAAFQKPAVPERKADLASLIADVCGRAQPWPEPEIKAIFGYMGGIGDDGNERLPETPDTPNIQETFQRRARNCRTKGRIHAEIQLVAYCELRRKLSNLGTIRETIPRVIRSHKAACYLCNLFITECFQKTYFTSRSHGRLYPGWRLLQCFSKDVQTRFNYVLAERIKDSIETLRRRREKTNYPQPAESELTYLPSLSGLAIAENEAEIMTEMSDQGAAEVGGEIFAINTNNVDDADDAGDVSGVNDLDGECGAQPAELEDGQKEALDTAVPDLQNIQDISDRDASAQGTSASPTVSAHPPPADGKPQHSGIATENLLSNGYVRVNDAAASALYRIGDLELQVEYSRQDNKRHLYFVAEQLSGTEVERLGIDRVLTMADIDSLRPSAETRVSVDDHGCLYLAVAGGVYQVSFVFR